MPSSSSSSSGDDTTILLPNHNRPITGAGVQHRPIVVGVGDRFKASEIGSSPDFEGSIPGDGVEKGTVTRKGKTGDGVDVMDPGGFLVAAHLNVVVGREETKDTVAVKTTTKTPWMQVSKSRSLLLAVKPVVFLGAIGMGIVLHLTLLAFNALSIQSLSAVFGDRESVFAKKENARALIIVSSQKALVIVVTVVEQLRGSLGETGLLVLPCVAAHINQVIIDSILVNFWLQKDLASNNLKEV